MRKIRRWEEIPEFMKNEEAYPYWEILSRKQAQLWLKRFLDLVFSVILLVILSFPMLLIAAAIKLDSPGPVFFRQERVTQYGRRFRIHKFRTMVHHADRMGSAVTTKDDSRITRVGLRIRRLRLDELPQLIDVLQGTMTFVGTRPEAVEYVEHYKPEYNATLLLPAGITSECSIRYKDEDQLLDGAEDADRVYVEQILPEKMKWNLRSLKEFSLLSDVRTVLRTVGALLGKEYGE